MTSHTNSSSTEEPLVRVAEFRTDSRYRLVHFQGEGWKPLAPEEFEPEVHHHFPDLDPRDPARVHWDDRPWEWPAWRPGEA
ncbi:hypothetical protein K353_01318 [Kitasatospora sp. SolWspMP-SS2h]|uniref:hypothetical protein n=1 Tax=Kitasatospora sp. SolWspMP-SS2h TaxID=1305729 RepID=UPI000DBA8426|nr:hypothetical protein [Kitasatospora sp. SolWspMP-SS2h]RAJ44741.1 hypothetical protein K353_01318 [Kitasatospora sp. SolWspMP-SS2h]